MASVAIVGMKNGEATIPTTSAFRNILYLILPPQVNLCGADFDFEESCAGRACEIIIAGGILKRSFGVAMWIISLFYSGDKSLSFKYSNFRIRKLLIGGY